MMKRRLFTAMLALAMLFCFAGCSKDTLAQQGQNNTPEAPATIKPAETPKPADEQSAAVSKPTETSNEIVTLADFNSRLKDSGSAYKAYTADAFGWHNNTISVDPFRTTENTNAYGVRVSYAAAKNTDTVEWENPGDSSYTIDEKNKTMSEPMAKWLLNVMAKLNSAITVAEAEGLAAPTFITTAGVPAQTDEYPFSDEWVTLSSFTQALTNDGSNFTRMGSAPAWSNGSLAISFYLPVSDPVSGPGEYYLRMWVLADERQVETMWVQSQQGPKTLDSQNRMSLELAKGVWDFTQFCNNASTHEDIKAFVAAERGQMGENSGRGSSMAVGEYPFSGKLVAESEFKKALEAKNSSWSPCQPYGGDAFAWSNGALVLQPYNTGNPDYDGSDQYGMYIYLYGAPDGQSVQRSRSSSSGPCTVTDKGISIGLAEQLWDFMAAFEQANTMEEIFDNKDYRGNFFYEDGYSK